MTARLTSEFWVQAYLARLSVEGIFAHVACRGDATAGAVAVKVADMSGTASLFTRSYDADGTRIWVTHLENAPEAEVDAAVSKQRSFDRDLWVVEVEDPRGRHLLNEPGLE